MRALRHFCTLTASVSLTALVASRAVAQAPKKAPDTSVAAKAAARQTASAAAAAPGEDPDLPAWATGVDKETLLKEREKHIALLRGFPDLAAKPDLRLKAIQQMDSQKKIGVTAGPTTWTEIGPFPIPNGQTELPTVNPVSGRVTAFEIDPTNNSILYLGTAFGGVWRSTNGGTNWTPIFDSASTLAIGALTLAPNHHTLWVGTGEANGSCDSYSGVGLYRIDSADTAATLVGPINPVRSYTDNLSVLQNVPAFTGNAISKILVNPANSDMVFVSTVTAAAGIGCDYPALGGGIPPRGIPGVYRLTAATGVIGSIGVERIKVSTLTGCHDLPCTGDNSVGDMVFDPADATGNTLLVWQDWPSPASGGAGVFRSTNAAGAATSVTFAQTFVEPTSFAGSGRGVFAIYKPAGSTVVYVASGEYSGSPTCSSIGDAGAVRQSIDGGVTWSAVRAGSGGFCGGQCFYNFGLAVTPGASPALDAVYIGGNVTGAVCSRLFAKSADGGATFANSATGLHADTHFIKVDPTNPAIIYHGNDGGIFKSVDTGATWTSLNNNPLSAAQYQSIATHPSDVNYSIGGTQDNGTHMLTAVGTFTRADYGDGGYTLIDRGALDTINVTMYHTYFNQAGGLMGLARVTKTACATDNQWIFRGAGFVNGTITSCEGVAFAAANGISGSAVLFYAPIALGPGSPSNTVYYGSDGLYRSTNKGDTMTLVSQALSDAISNIAIHPGNDGMRLVGLKNGQVFRTLTGTNPLTDVTPGSGWGAKFVARVVFDPNDATGNTAWVAVGGYFGAATGHVWKTTNLGAATPTWTAMAGSGGTSIPDVPVNALLIDPLNSNHVYAGTDIGIYYSSDGGTAWNPLGSSLPKVAIFDMAFNGDPSPASRIIRIATHGRGMWELIPPTPVTLTRFRAD